MTTHEIFQLILTFLFSFNALENFHMNEFWYTPKICFF
jgi:hypothetical protein